MQDQAGPFAGCPPRSRSVAEIDDCSRQNPAYRSATEEAPNGVSSISGPTARLRPRLRRLVAVLTSRRNWGEQRRAKLVEQLRDLIRHSPRPTTIRLVSQLR